MVGTCVNYKSAILHNFCQFDFIAIINWKLSDKLIDSQVSDEVVEIFGTDGWRDKWAKKKKKGFQEVLADQKKYLSIVWISLIFEWRRKIEKKQL